MSDELREAVRTAMSGGAGESSDEAGTAGGDAGSGGAGGVPDGAGDAPSRSGVSDGPSVGGDKGGADSVRSRDDKGRFAPGSPEAKAAEAVEKKAAPVAPKAVKPAPTTGMDTRSSGPTPAVAPTEALKAPQSWKPAAREHFARLPPEVQAEVARREKEIASGLQEAAPSKQEAAAWRQVVAPFEAQIRAEGGNPHQAVQSLLQTAHALRDPRHAPRIVAEIVRNFGISIEALDSALSGQPMPQGGQHAPQQEPPDYRQAVREELGALARAQKEKQISAELQDFLADPPEFYDDVKPVMIGLLTSGAAKGFKEAYESAVWSRTDLRGILQQRERAANAHPASTQRTRAASSSLKTQPASAAPAPASSNTQDDVRAAVAALSGR